MKGGGAPKSANSTSRTSGCGARHAVRCCHLTALRARAPSGAPPRTRFGELTPPLSSSRASWDSASSGVTRIFPYPSPASSSQAGRYYRPGGVRSRPGAGLRAPPAGTALASVIRPSPVTPFEEASFRPSNYTGDVCQGLRHKKRDQRVRLPTLGLLRSVDGVSVSKYRGAHESCRGSVAMRQHPVELHAVVSPNGR